MLALSTFSSSSSSSSSSSASPNPRRLTPNILACRITHSGPISSPQRYWNPSKVHKDSSTTTQTSYLRGRKLLGKSVKLPANCTGLILQKTDKILPAPAKQEDGDDEEGDETMEVKVMEAIGTFDEVVAWGHEMVPEEVEDVYIKGLQEWIGFAETMHSYDIKDEAKSSSCTSANEANEDTNNTTSV